MFRFSNQVSSIWQFILGKYILSYLIRITELLIIISKCIYICDWFEGMYNGEFTCNTEIKNQLIIFVQNPDHILLYIWCKLIRTGQTTKLLQKAETFRLCSLWQFMWYIMDITHMLNIHLFGTCGPLSFCCSLGCYPA